MTTVAVELATSTFGLLLVGGFLAWLPVSRGSHAFFGINVPLSIYEAEGRELYRRWKGIVFATTALAIAVCTLATAWGPERWLAIDAIADSVLTVGLLLTYVGFTRRARRWSTPSGVALTAALQRRPDHVVPWIEVVALGGTFCSVAIGCWMWTSRAGVDAKAFDSTAQRILMVLAFPLACTYFQLIMLLSRRELAASAIRLASENAATLYALRTDYLRANLAALDAGRVLTGSIAAGVAFAFLGAIAFDSPAGTFAGVVLTLAGAGLGFTMLIRSTRAMLQAQSAITAHGGVPLGPGEEKYWTWGASVYRNPNDPAFVVEKRVGLGYTINMAHPRAKYFFALLAGLLLLAGGFIALGIAS